MTKLIRYLYQGTQIPNRVFNIPKKGKITVWNFILLYSHIYNKQNKIINGLFRKNKKGGIFSTDAQAKDFACWIEKKINQHEVFNPLPKL